MGNLDYLCELNRYKRQLAYMLHCTKTQLEATFGASVLWFESVGQQDGRSTIVLK